MTLRALVTDLDGTLTHNDGVIPQSVTAALAKLEGRIIRVVATGRTLNAVKKVIPPGFPIDYLIFSCGAGIMEWQSGRLLASFHMKAAEIQNVMDKLFRLELDFMLHQAIPDNHKFFYFGTGRENADFTRRCQRNADHAMSGRLSFPVLLEATQFIVVEPPSRGTTHYDILKKELAPLSVIRTTSPLDNESLWIEILAPGITKARGTNWLLGRSAIGPSEVMAIGNDYNDIELLEWAGTKAVVGDAAQDLRNRFPVMKGAGPEGFLEFISNL